MKCFKVVQRVLEDTYAEIPGDEAVRDDAIRTAIQSNSAQYGQVLANGGPDFSEPVTRFAYVYNYVPVHAHWVNELIEWSTDARAILAQDKVRVACIGGGPGSDVVGILKYIDESGKDPPSLFCEIADGCEQWKLTWSDVGFTLDWPAHLNTDYVIHRIGDPQVWTHPTKFAKADLFTVSFFASEVAHLGQPAWDYFGQVMGMARPGAILLFNDNNDSRFYEPFDAVAAAANWTQLIANGGIRKVYDRGERTDELGRFNAKFGWCPKLTGDVAWRVLRKQGP